MIMDATNPSLLLLFLLLLGRGLSLVAAGSYENLTMGSSLSSSGPNSSIFSPSGDFAFGFWPLDTNPSLFLLAVWFNSTSPQVVVWFATNSTSPVQVPAKSTLRLTQADQLSLSDPTGQEVWNPDEPNISGVSLLNSGNLVIYDSSGALLWQSFQNPTDTILPGQSLAENSELRSRMTESDFSLGRFELAVQSDGNLVFYPIAIPTGNRYHAYWASNTQYDANLQFVFNSSGTLYYKTDNTSQTPLISATIYSPTDSYQRATLDPDGALRLYIYSKNNTNNKSNDTWTVVGMFPADLCKTIQTDGDDGGGGACGLNAYCNFDDNQQTQLSCKCALGCKFVDTNRTYLGCVPDFTIQSCDDYQSNQYTFKEMPNTDWPSNSYAHYTPTDEDTCRASCLADCLCSAAVFQGSDCWKIKMPLTNGWQGLSVGGKTLIKVPKTNASLPTQVSQSPTTMARKDHSMLIPVISALLGSSGFLNVLFIIVVAIVSFSFCNRRKNKKNQIDSTMLRSNLRVFTYKELEKATNNFQEELGCGAFGIVYKGALAAEFLTVIAVKKLDRVAKESEHEFTNEVWSIAQTHHKNLVKLLGFCNEGSHRMLVYEYMSNGSLTSFLFGSTKLEWNKRAQIVMGIARGLSYLHEECTIQIIHCDVKSQNILLDDDFIPKISDFGIAKLLRADQTRTNTAIRGTKGYVAPEWFKNTAVTTKVDVYSFGVLLLEIVCCRKNVQTEPTTEEAAVLTYWAYDCFRDGRLDLLVDFDEEAMIDVRIVERFVMVAIWCIQEEPSLRPSMRKVAQMLEGAVAVAIPPDPSSCIRSIP